MINWHSNVFPGVLGAPAIARASRLPRGRVEDGKSAQPSPSAGLKRVAADYKDDIRARSPAPAREKRQAHRIDRRGPASLTVARDLLPLGYHCVLYDQDAARRHDAHADSKIPSAGNRARRGSELHPRP
jgi:hypothetical protein